MYLRKYYGDASPDGICSKMRQNLSPFSLLKTHSKHFSNSLKSHSLTINQPSLKFLPSTSSTSKRSFNTEVNSQFIIFFIFVIFFEFFYKLVEIDNYVKKYIVFAWLIIYTYWKTCLVVKINDQCIIFRGFMVCITTIEKLNVAGNSWEASPKFFDVWIPKNQSVRPQFWS